MEGSDMKFDEQDSGAPVTSPDMPADPLGPQHSTDPGVEGGGGGGGGGGNDPAEAIRDRDRSETAGADPDPTGTDDGGPAIPSRGSGIDESDVASGL